MRNVKIKLLSILCVVALVVLAGCDLLRRAARPAAVGAELAACDQTTATWPEYTACCLDVARRYPLADGGARDAAACFAPEGGS